MAETERGSLRVGAEEHYGAEGNRYRGNGVQQGGPVLCGAHE